MELPGRQSIAYPLIPFPSIVNLPRLSVMEAGFFVGRWVIFITFAPWILNAKRILLL
jgi:hypothetical protein